MKLGIGVLDEKSSKREFRENRLNDIRRLECLHVSSGWFLPKFRRNVGPSSSNAILHGLLEP
jgi:hypothetical protein